MSFMKKVNSMKEVKYIIDYRAKNSHLYIGNNGKFLLNLPIEARQRDVLYKFAFNSLRECIEYLRCKFQTDDMYNYFECCTVDYNILAVEFKPDHVNVTIALAKSTNRCNEVLEDGYVIVVEHDDGNCAFYGKDLVYLGTYFKGSGGFSVYCDRIIQYSFDSLQETTEYAYENRTIWESSEHLNSIMACKIVVLNRSDIAVTKIAVVE